MGIANDNINIYGSLQWAGFAGMIFLYPHTYFVDSCFLPIIQMRKTTLCDVTFPIHTASKW